MFKKLLALILVFLLVLSLGGCRKKQKTEVKNYSGIELKYYKVFDDADIMESLISEYIIAHPGIKIHYKKFDDFSEYYNTILNEMAEGEGPDIFSMQNSWFYSNYRKLTPMPPKAGTTRDFENTFVDVAYKDLVRTDQNGAEQIYALPMTVDTLALYYNKEHFADRLPAQGKPSLTWDGIKEDVEKLIKDDNSFDRFEVSGIALGRGDNILRAVDILYLLFLQHGVQFYNQNISQAIFATQQGAVGDFPAAESLDFYVSFADENQQNYTWNQYAVDVNSAEKEIEAFSRGEVSMIVGYAYTYDLIMNKIAVLKSKGLDSIDESAVRVAPVPQIDDPAVSTEKRVTYASYFAEAVSRNTKHPEIAWDFLIFMTSKKIQQEYFDKLKKPTSRRDLIEEQKKHPIFGVFASQIGYAESFPILDYYRYKEIFENVIYQVLEGEYSKKALGEAQAMISKLLPSGGLYIKPKRADDLENK